MAQESNSGNPDILTPVQAHILEGFVDGHLPGATLGPVVTSYYEQASAHLRDTLDNFEADLHTPQRVYDLMTGLSIGTVWVENLIEHGLTAEQAGTVMRVSLASLLSGSLSRGDKLESTIEESNMQSVEELDPRVAETLKPQETAIIVVDVMDGYCSPEAPLPKYLSVNAGATFKELDEAADRMVSFLAATRKQPIATTVFARMIERPDTSPASIRLKMEVDESPAVAEKDGEGWDYYKVQPQAGDHEIVKYAYDSFRGTDLDNHLKGKSVKTVIIIGGYASMCVDITARTAAQLGYNTFVPADLTADPTFPGSPQNPETIRKKLSAINEVLGYMPLSSTILDFWNS